MKNDDHDGNGTYIIVLYLDKRKRIQIGKLGQFKFKSTSIKKEKIYARCKKD